MAIRVELVFLIPLASVCKMKTNKIMGIRTMQPGFKTTQHNSTDFSGNQVAYARLGQSGIEAYDNLLSRQGCEGKGVEHC